MLERLLVTIVASFVSLSQPLAHQHGVDLSVVQTKCLTEAIYFESRGEGVAGSTAVAYVALNRATDSGGSLCEVIHKPGQFSYYNRHRKRIVRDLDSWSKAADVAVNTQLHLSANPVGDATMYNNRKMPTWRDTRLYRKINHHYFYVKEAQLDHVNSMTAMTEPSASRPRVIPIAITQHKVRRGDTRKGIRGIPYHQRKRMLHRS